MNLDKILLGIPQVESIEDIIVSLILIFLMGVLIYYLNKKIEEKKYKYGVKQ